MIPDKKPNRENESQKANRISDELDQGESFNDKMSGFQDQERVNLKILMEKMGAIYEPELSSACRYLICRFKGTPKLLKARQLRRETGATIYCVSEQFFIDCFVFNHLVPVANYLVE